MSKNTSLLIETAISQARKLEEVAGYHEGHDLVERMKHAFDGAAIQRTLMAEAAATMLKMAEELQRGRRRGR